MVNISFINNYLKSYINNRVIAELNGFIETTIYIEKFHFKIYENYLLIKNNSNVVLKIIFNEVRYVICENNKILIEFNIGEKILMYEDN